jgi:hypothetical protein
VDAGPKHNFWSALVLALRVLLFGLLPTDNSNQF